MEKYVEKEVEIDGNLRKLAKRDENQVGKDMRFTIAINVEGQKEGEDKLGR